MNAKKATIHHFNLHLAMLTGNRIPPLLPPEHAVRFERLGPIILSGCGLPANCLVTLALSECVWNFFIKPFEKLADWDAPLKKLCSSAVHAVKSQKKRTVHFFCPTPLSLRSPQHFQAAWKYRAKQLNLCVMLIDEGDPPKDFGYAKK